MPGSNGREIRLAMLAALPIDGSAIKVRKALAKQPDGKMHGAVRLPCETGERRMAAVKVADDSGIESLNVIPRGIDKGLDKVQER